MEGSTPTIDPEMDSQSSTHTTSMTMRPQISTRPTATIVAAAQTTGVYSPTPFFPIAEGPVLMYPSAQLTFTPAMAPCLFSFCTCAMGPSQHTCSIHQQPPIAYGQASSSFLSGSSQSAAHQQPISSTTTSQPPSSEQSSSAPAQPTAQRMEQSIEMARNQTRLPATLSSRSLPLRLKRPAQLSAQTSAPKLRRVASDTARDVQTVSSETVPQQTPVQVIQPEAAPPSTSQLVTGTVPSSHQMCSLCNGSSHCPSCNCSTRLLQGAARHFLFRTAVPIAVQASRVLPAAATPRSQHQQSLLQQLALQQQQQIMYQNHLRSYLGTANTPGLFVPLNRPAGLSDALLVNVAHPDYFLDRPLERHHMFGAPVTDPQPVGLSVQDIDKYSEKVQFVKDVEVPDDEQERCTVCQCELETGEEVRHLSCSHQFHVGCIDRWLGYNKKCPVCRLDIDQPKAVFIE